MGDFMEEAAAARVVERPQVADSLVVEMDGAELNIFFDTKIGGGHLKVQANASKESVTKLLKFVGPLTEWLAANGAIIRPATGPRPAMRRPQGSAPRRAPQRRSPAASIACPQCGGEMWDNRPKKANGTFKPNSPDYSCKDKDGCGYGIWPEHQQDSDFDADEDPFE